MGDPAIPDVHGDAVAVVVDAGGDGEEFEAAGVAVLVVGAVSVVVEAVHEDAPVVNLAMRISKIKIPSHKIMVEENFPKKFPE